MNKRFFLQMVLAASFACLLLFLFWKSDVDIEGHSRNINILLTLQRDEAEFRRIMELGYRGGLNNYDPLMYVQKKRLLGFNQLVKNSRNMRIYHEFFTQVQSAIAEYSRRIADVEQFKQRLSTRRLAQLYFPHVSKELRQKIQLAASTDIPISVSRIALLERIVRIHTNLDNYLMGNVDSADEIDQDLLRLRQDMTQEEGEIPQLVKSFDRYAVVQKMATQDAHKLLLKLADGKQKSTLRQLHYDYLRHFNKIQQQAGFYRMALFAFSILLLVYLARIFFNLQTTSLRLQDSIKNLDFRQFALDQHAIVSATNLKGEITYANDRFCEVSQYTQEELIGQKHSVLKSGEHDDAFYREMWRTVAKGGVWHGTICNKAKNGSLYWVESTILARLGIDGKPLEYIAMRTDITAKILAERDIAWLAKLPEENPDPVMRLNQHAEILYSNAAAKEMFKRCRENSGACHDDVMRFNVAKVLEFGRVQEQSVVVDDRDYLLTFAPVVDAGYVNVYARDVTDKREAERLLNYQASHDQLTGLANRHRFEQRLDEVVEIAQHEKTQSMLLYMDLDQFKIVNDTSGHVAGDELLRQISQTLLNNVRDHDLLARIGGDEFALLLANCDKEHGLKIADKLLRVISDFTFSWENRFFGIGVSIGAVLIDENSESRNAVLAAADMSCYNAKDAGRNRVSFYSMDDEEASQRRNEMHWASLIPEALVNDQFVLMVQSIVPLQSDSKKGGHYEVLIRLRADDGKLIAPGGFIPAAERYGLMPAIDSWVVRKVLNAMADLRIRGANLADWRFAVNLSGASMGDQEMISYIKEQVISTGIPPGSLSFEVTETTAVSNLNEAIAFIKTLRDLGCHFALDDFGSGLSSFAYLKNLPVDYLKIDGAFVRDILDDKIDAAMVKSINEIGHEMGIETIAEFVENDEIMERLRCMGVDYAQGYGIDQPQELEPLINKRLQEEPFLVDDLIA